MGALTSTRFRFAERVFYLDKQPSLCTGCDAGCNITIEHRRGAIKRYKPRFNPEVNDYWMCDYGRSTFERYRTAPRLTSPRLRRPAGRPARPEARPGAAAAVPPLPAPVSWKEALDAVARCLRSRSADGAVAFLGSGFLTTEEAYLFAQLAEVGGTPHRSVAVDPGPERHIPNLQGGVTGREAAPNRRGAELAGLAVPGSQADPAAAAAPAATVAPAANGGVIDAASLLHGDGAARCAVLVVCDSDFGAAAWDPATVERLRQAQALIVFGWADSPLAQAADVALPVATHAEKDGTFVNVEWRVQRFERAFPPPGQARPAVEALSELLARYDARWANLTAPAVFDRLAAALPAFAGLSWHRLAATGAALALPAARAFPESHLLAPEDTAVGI